MLGDILGYATADTVYAWRQPYVALAGAFGDWTRSKMGRDRLCLSVYIFFIDTEPILSVALETDK
eukprot:5633725-Pyramimonas_sp.AAC.1